MASKKKTPPVTTASETSQDTKLYVLGDDAIAMIREVLQLTLYTGTNIIDHLRAMRLEEVPSHPGKLVPNEAYVAAYNEMVAAFAKRAQEMAEEARKNAAREVAESTTTIQ